MVLELPYKKGKRLPSEHASKLGHLDVLQSPLVNELITDFESLSEPREINFDNWEEIPPDGEPLPYIFVSDGSRQVMNSDSLPYKRIAFVKIGF